MSSKQKVRFLVNLGTRDAHALGLDHKNCVCGSVLSVSDESAAWLMHNGHAVAVNDIPKVIEAVPQKATIAKAKEPEIKE